MKLRRTYTTVFICCLTASLGLAIPSQAQFNRYGGGYNQYGGGYNQYGGGYNQYGGGYNQYGGGYNQYGGSYGGGFSGNRYGGNRSGSGYNSYGGGYGNYGGGYNQYGGMGGRSGMGGMGGMSGRSRSSRSGGYGNNASYGGGYNQYNQQAAGGTARGRGRSNRTGNLENFGGQVPNTASTQPGQPKQTTPGGTASERRGALSGKTATRGALPGAPAPGGTAGDVQIQGAVSAPAGPGAAKGRPAPRTKEQDLKTKPMATLYMEAANQIAVIDQPKVVSIILSNNKVEYDRLSFTLQYDPNDLKPLSGQDASGKWIEAKSIPLDIPSTEDSSPDAPSEESKSILAKNPNRYEILENTIDTQTGEIRFSMKVKEGSSVDNGEIVHLSFLPLRETQTTISFVFNDLKNADREQASFTALTLADADQLGSRFNPTDGVINLDLQIYSTLEKARERMVVKKAGEKQIEDESDDTFFNTQISLIPRESNIEVGKIVEIDVVVNNPNKEVFDSVALLIAYNPRIFEVLDGDDFSPGINIDDRNYKDRFPLDFPILNTVDSERGIIDYRKKSMRTPAREEGVLATIKLRAIRPTKKTTFRLFINQTGEEPTTGLFYRNADRLGDPLDIYDGVNTCSIGVRPTTAYLKKIRS